jgi:hypothetical protein
MATTVAELQSTASRLGMPVEERLSVSPHVPRTISFRAPDAPALEELANIARLGLCWLDLGSLDHSSRHDGTSAAPGHYECIRRWSKWSLKEGVFPDVVVEHCMRRDRPDYWLVSWNGKQIWFYELNIARAWAAALIGEAVVTAAGEAFLEANHAFVPLPIARTASVLGAGLPGPTAVGTYRYPAGTLPLRQLMVDIISRTFDPARLAGPAAAQATG